MYTAIKKKFKFVYVGNDLDTQVEAEMDNIVVVGTVVAHSVAVVATAYIVDIVEVVAAAFAALIDSATTGVVVAASVTVVVVVWTTLFQKIETLKVSQTLVEAVNVDRLRVTSMTPIQKLDPRSMG